jgi:lysophospholipase L1-like esterase
MHAGTMNATVRRALGIARWVVPFVVLPLVAMVLALLVTPPVAVSAFGQTVEVGAVTPSPGLGLSGPGEADLFGEGTLATVQHFSGPIRPKIVWQRFNRNDDASSFLQSSSANGRRTVATGSREVGAALADGWSQYFRRLFLVAALIGGALYLLGVGAVALAEGHDHRHRSRRHHLALLGLSVALSLVVTAAFTALTVVSAAHQLGKVTSLSDLVGTAKLAPVPITVGAKRTDVDVVVIGDSTAAGIGNTPIVKPTRAERVCRRSADAYADQLASLTGLKTLNLACSSATITNGLLGPQDVGTATLEPQVGLLKSVTSASVVIVSVGANDVGWSDFLRYCYGLSRCDDQASESLFLSRLDSFKVQYTQLLQQLSDLPNHPNVIVNEYYDPFGQSFDCPDLIDPKALAGAPKGYGFAADPGQDDQDEKIAQKIDPLESELARMNDVIEQGAQAFGFSAVRPHFEGHELCTDQSWVQGMSDTAPFHPNSAGELAIAAYDLPYVRAATPT